MRRIGKPLVLLLVLYMLFDLRPLLLIPNLILYLKPCARFTNGGGAIEMKVFPRLCVAGDPIRAVIRSHDLPLGNAFERTYDRSGIFPELEFSGSVNNAHPVETLYWTICIGGGLGGGEVHPEKKIWVGDYVHFRRLGRYRVNFRYREGSIDYDLGNFSIIYLPENPVSKFLKQFVLGVGLFVPSDEVREVAAKWLGYQETVISTYALAKYRSVYEDEWRSTNHPHNNSLAEAYRGVLRNYNFCLVGKILRRFEQDHRNSILAAYFQLHCYRLIFSGDNPGNQDPTQVAQNDIARLIECTYVHMDETNKKDSRELIARFREQQTDEFWLTRIDKYEHDLARATNQTQIASLQNRKKWSAASLAAKKERDLRLRLIDNTLTLLEEENRKSGQSPTNTVERTASH